MTPESRERACVTAGLYDTSCASTSARSEKRVHGSTKKCPN